MLQTDTKLRHLVRRAVTTVQQEMEGEKIPSMPPEFSQDEGQRLTDQMAANAAVPASFGARNRYEPVWRSISPTDGGLQGDVEE